MSGRFFSDSASIDIATNFASFDAIDFSRDFPDFLDGNFSTKHLLTLIHEASHHWCLTTPVGTALAARTFATYSEAFQTARMLSQGESVPVPTARRLLQSVITSRMLTEFFVPLLEGMALYAEWRATPLTGGTYSRPFDIYNKFSGASLSVDPEDDAYRGLKEGLTDKTAQERVDVLEAWIKSDQGQQADRQLVFRIHLELRRLRADLFQRSRFRRVLTSPLDPRVSSYQLGYLFVCAMERLCWGAENTDRFLAYLREYFLHDYDLASAILSADVATDDLFSLVREKMQAKVNDVLVDTERAAERLRAWGERVTPAAFENQTVEDFFGRAKALPDGQDPESGNQAFENYKAHLEAFCSTAASGYVSPVMLRNFLVGGRVIMPLGTKAFTVSDEVGDRLQLNSDDGAELSLFVGDFGHRPSLHTTVIVSMLVNVASPGTSVSVRWDDHFEVVPLAEDTVSKQLIEAAYHTSEQIGQVVAAGQEVIGSLSLQDDEHGIESIEQIVSGFLNHDTTALDIVQIYRAAIATAFAAEIPPIMDAAWRREIYAAFEPEGLGTLLEEPADFDLFLTICGMPFTHYTSVERLREAGEDGSDAELQRIVSAIFEAANGISEQGHDRAVVQLRPIFERSGLSMFSPTTAGGWASAL
jgi:hypothetical protein